MAMGKAEGFIQEMMNGQKVIKVFSHEEECSKDFEKINNELVKFNPELAQREQIVVGNKIDLASDEQLERLEKYFTEKGYQYFTMCAPIVEGTQEIINAVAAKLATLPPIKRFEKEFNCNIDDFEGKLRVSQSKYPILLSAGELENCNELFNELKKLNPKQTDIIILPGCNHGNGMYKQTNMYQNKIKEFINRYL